MSAFFFLKWKHWIVAQIQEVFVWRLTFSILGVHPCLCAAVILAFLCTWFIKLNLDMYVCVFKDSDVFTMEGGGEKDNERLRVTSRAPENTNPDWVQTAHRQALFERWRSICLLTSWGRSRAGVMGLSPHLKVMSKDEDVFSVVTVMALPSRPQLWQRMFALLSLYNHDYKSACSFSHGFRCLQAPASRLILMVPVCTCLPERPSL